MDKLDIIIEKRLKFNKAFNLPIAKKPTLITSERACLQYDMMKEELTEYYEAQNRFNKDISETTDALIDMFEILIGMFAEHGMINLIPQLYEEVNKSNMSKLDDNGKPLINGVNGVLDNSRPLGKVIKSKNFVEPNFLKILTGNEA